MDYAIGATVWSCIENRNFLAAILENEHARTKFDLYYVEYMKYTYTVKYKLLWPSKGRGRSRMTSRARLDGDMKDMGLRPGMTMD